MHIPLLDLKAQYKKIKSKIDSAIFQVLQEQTFILGPVVEKFEQQITNYVGTRYAVGVSSGSDALLLSLMLLDIQPGDEVITTAFSFFATAGAIVRAGAKPVFVDIDSKTFNLNISLVANRLSPKTRAIIPVHLFGRSVDMDKLAESAPKIPIIEDAAQSLGAEHNKKKAGSFGFTGCFSFFPSKNLGGFGDGGMITTNNEDISHKLRALRAHGQFAGKRYEHQIIGGNFRLDAIQAAVLSAKLPFLEEWTNARRKNAHRYCELFEQSGIDIQLPPKEAPNSRDVFNQFVICVQNRDQLRAYLTDKGIGTAIYYPRGLHEQPCLKYLGYKAGDFPHTEKIADQCLALPVCPELSEREIEEVVSRTSEFLKNN